MSCVVDICSIALCGFMYEYVSQVLTNSLRIKRFILAFCTMFVTSSKTIFKATYCVMRNTLLNSESS